MYFVYILQSEEGKNYYVGHAKDLGIRLKQQNDGKVTSTKSRRPWKIVHREKLETKQEAYRRELQIKSYKGGEAFRKLLK